MSHLHYASDQRAVPRPYSQPQPLDVAPPPRFLHSSSLSSYYSSPSAYAPPPALRGGISPSHHSPQGTPFQHALAAPLQPPQPPPSQPQPILPPHFRLGSPARPSPQAYLASLQRTAAAHHDSCFPSAASSSSSSQPCAPGLSLSASSSSSPPPPPPPSSTGLSAGTLAHLASLDIDRLSSQELDVVAAILAKGQKLQLAGESAPLPSPPPPPPPAPSPPLPLPPPPPPPPSHFSSANFSSPPTALFPPSPPAQPEYSLGVTELQLESQRLEALQAEQFRELAIQRQLQQLQQQQQQQQQQQHLAQQQHQSQQPAAALFASHFQLQQQQQRQQLPFTPPFAAAHSPTLAPYAGADQRNTHDEHSFAQPSPVPIAPAPSISLTHPTHARSHSLPQLPQLQPASLPHSTSFVLDADGRHRLLRAILTTPAGIAAELYHLCLSSSACLRRLLQLLTESASAELYDATLVARAFIQQVDAEVQDASRAAASAGGQLASFEHPLLLPIRLHVVDVVKAQLLPSPLTGQPPLAAVQPVVKQEALPGYRIDASDELVRHEQAMHGLPSPTAYSLQAQTHLTAPPSAVDLSLPAPSSLLARSLLSPIAPPDTRRRSSLSHLIGSLSPASLEQLQLSAHRMHSDSSHSVPLPLRRSLIRSGGSSHSSGSLDAMTIPPALSAESSASSSYPSRNSTGSRHDTNSPHMLGLSTPPQLPIPLSYGQQRASFDLISSLQPPPSQPVSTPLLLHAGSGSTNSSPAFDEPHSVFPSAYPLHDSWHEGSMEAANKQQGRLVLHEQPRDAKRGKQSPSVNTTDNSSSSPSPRSMTRSSIASTTAQSLASALAQTLSSTRLGSSPPVFSDSSTSTFVSTFQSGPSASTFIPIQTPTPNVQPGTLTASTKQRMRSISFSAPSPPLEHRQLEEGENETDSRYALLQAMQERQKEQQRQRANQQQRTVPRTTSGSSGKVAREWRPEPGADVPTFSSSVASHSSAQSTATSASFTFSDPSVAAPLSTSSSDASQYTAFFSSPPPTQLDDLVPSPRHAQQAAPPPLLSHYMQEGMQAPQPYLYSAGVEALSGQLLAFERQRKKRRKSGELAEHEKWYCPQPGCHKFYRRTSTNSIKKHQDAHAGVWQQRPVVLEETEGEEAEEEEALVNSGASGSGTGGDGLAAWHVESAAAAQGNKRP